MDVVTVFIAVIFVIIIAGLTILSNDNRNSTITPVNPPPPVVTPTCVCIENMKRILRVILPDSNANLQVSISLDGIDSVTDITISRLPGDYDGSYVLVNPPIMGKSN